jgi:NADPH-dependent glutamate synthase beta subunit-like oxidoreductase
VVAEKDAGHFDAVFLAVGAEVANHLDIPSMDGGKMIDALELLEQVKQGQPPKLGRVVGIVGAGNTAVDAARVARRLGAEAILIIAPTANTCGTPRRGEEAFAEA